MDLTTLFCDIDDFVKALDYSADQILLDRKRSKRGSKAKMSLSEILTIIVLYHSSNFKNFKSFYLYIRQEKRSEFPRIISYNRFVEWMPYCLLPLCSYLKTRIGSNAGVKFIDSCPIAVCKNIRIPRNKVFRDFATRGKSSMGWFFGFKLHIVVNEKGELLSFKITKGNTDDRVPAKELCKNISGKLFGDRGYISKKLFKELWDDGVHLITNVKSNMKNALIPLNDKLMLRKRFIIETINDQLKNISDIEHSRHRSPINFMVNIVAGLISYTWKDKRPSITTHENFENALAV